MELYQLSDGSKTIYLRSKTYKRLDGWDYSDYLPEITQSTDPYFEGMPFVEVLAGTFTTEYKEIATLTGTEFDVTYLIWDEEPDTSPFVVFTGKAQFQEYTVKDDKNFREEVFAKYNLVDDRTILEDDLLSAAYDLKQVDTDTATYNDGRLLPMNFGYIKYAPAFMLAITCATGCGGVYSADGKTTNMTQEGIDTNFIQGAGATTVTVTDPKPPLPVYQDADATGTTASTVTAEPIVTPVQAALTTSNVSIVETVSATDYVAYATDQNGLESFSIDTNGNVKTGGIIQSINGTASTATRLTIQGAYISDQTGVGTSTRLSYVLTKDGQNHWYYYNTTTNQWSEDGSVGRSTIGTDVVIFYSKSNVISAFFEGTAGGPALIAKNTGGVSGAEAIKSQNNSSFPTVSAQNTGSGVAGYFDGGTRASVNFVPQDLSLATGMQNGDWAYNSNAGFGSGVGFYGYEAGAWVKK